MRLRSFIAAQPKERNRQLVMRIRAPRREPDCTLVGSNGAAEQTRIAHALEDATRYPCFGGGAISLQCAVDERVRLARGRNRSERTDPPSSLESGGIGTRQLRLHHSGIR